MKFQVAALMLALCSPGVCMGESAPAPAGSESSAGKGFQLSPQALKALEVKTQPVGSKPARLELPVGALVYFQDRVGVFRLRNGWFKFVEVRLLERPASPAKVSSIELKAGDQVVTRGAALLRVMQMNLEGSAE